MHDADDFIGPKEHIGMDACLGGTIPVLNYLEQKIISLVPNLRVQPVGVLSKVMMTMTSLMKDHTPP